MNQFEINDKFGYQNYDFLESVILKVLTHEKIKNSVVSIIFVGEEEIQKLNRETRGLDKITDVISFALEDGEELNFKESIRILGDIFVCIPRMKEQAESFGHSEKRELSFLVVHGLLHLLGYDHMTEEEEKEMFGLQEEILNEIGITR